MVGDLIVGANQPFAIDTDETFPPATSAFDTRAEDWVTLPRLTEPMESGLTASDGEHLWFGDRVLDAATRSWGDGEYRPETASAASTVWLGDRWFAFGGQTALGMTQRAFIWIPTVRSQGQS